MDLPVSAYEIVYKDHAVIVDTAFNADVAKQMDANVFDDAAYARLDQAGVRARDDSITLGVVLFSPRFRQRADKIDRRLADREYQRHC